MHVLQYIAVKADNAEEAVDSVRSQLEGIMSEEGSGATWYDWFVTGGGRWNPDNDPYTDGAINMVISQKQDPEAFTEKIHELIVDRLAEFNRYRLEWEASGVVVNDKLDTYDGIPQYDFSLYPMKKMIDMLQGNWDYNAYFMDIEHWSTNPKHLWDDTLNEGEWFLVPVDFHF